MIKEKPCQKQWAYHGSKQVLGGQKRTKGSGGLPGQILFMTFQTTDTHIMMNMVLENSFMDMVVKSSTNIPLSSPLKGTTSKWNDKNIVFLTDCNQCEDHFIMSFFCSVVLYFRVELYKYTKYLLCYEIVSGI